MLTPAAKQFRRENEILFSESESESEYEDSDNETSEPEIEREEDVPVSLTFEKVENERKCTGRPSRLRGAHIDLPKSRTISEETFESEDKLFSHVYGDQLWIEICLGTNEKAEKL